MPADIGSLITILGATKDLGLALVQERDRQKAATIQIDLSEKIIQSQAQLSEVLGSIIEKDRLIHTLLERVRELESQKSERDRYELAKVSVDGDFFAYRLRPATELHERSNEPTHFLCQPCFDAGKKSVLVAIETSFGVNYRCGICKEAVNI